MGELRQYLNYFCHMKSVSILVPETAIIEAVADPQYMFNAVNQFLISNGGAPLFNVQLVGLTKEVKLNGGNFHVHTDALIEDVKSTDIIFIPAVSGDMATAIQLNKKVIPWLIEQHKKGAELASLCMGAFILADTGLLDGKNCSTHWFAADTFRTMFPKVNLVDGLTITDENGIYSSGGANSYWSLLLHLVEKYTNRETAILASKFFEVDINRHSQSAFAIFTGQKAHHDEAIKKAQAFIENNVSQKISISELADKVAIGRRSFERRFKSVTNNSVLEYIQRVKIEAAKRSLENSRTHVSEVMYNVGYNDLKAFRTVFKKVTGLTPHEYRNRYNKKMLN